MLKNSKFNTVLAIIIAIVLWGYVAIEVNPTSTQVIRNVPIQFSNEDRLIESGYAVLSCDIDTVSVTYTGQRTGTKKLTADDFKVVVDLKGMTEGINTTTIRVSGPDGINIDTSSLQKVNVTVEKYKENVVNITPKVVNISEGDNEPYIVSMSKQEVTICGAESLVNSVVRADAILDASIVSTNKKAISCQLVPINKSGSEVEGVFLDKESVSITTLMLSRVTVPLKVNVIDDDGAVTREVTYPETITVKGDTKALIAISEIVCSDLDVTNIYETTEVELLPIIPDGIEISSDSERLIATVTVANGMKKSFTFNQDDILINNAPEEMKVELEEKSITISISGLASVISNLTEADFMLSADLPDEVLRDWSGEDDSDEANDKEFKTVLKIKVECDKIGIDSLTIEPEEILCKIMTSEI